MQQLITRAFATTRTSRHLYKTLLDNYTTGQLNKIPPGFNNNMLWNIAHVIVTQQRLTYMLSGLPMVVTDEMVQRYQKGTKPEADVTADEIAVIRELLFTTIDKTEEDYNNSIFNSYRPYKTEYGFEFNTIEEAIQFNNHHEGLHFGVLLSLKKFV